MKIAYHACRILLGGWFAYSGGWHFVAPWLQPLGETPEAIAFTRAMLASGLFGWIKAIELVTGVLMLLNRAIPLTILAIVPLNIVILYWNFVLDRVPVAWVFGILTIVANAMLAWPWRRYFWPMFTWAGVPDYSTDLGLDGARPVPPRQADASTSVPGSIPLR